MNTPHIIHNEKNAHRHFNLKGQLMWQGIHDYTIEPPVFLKQDPTAGVAQAHKNVVRKYYDKPEITIFEDDIVFTHKDSWKKYWEWYEELPEDWDIYLGGLYAFKTKVDATENLHKIRKSFTGIHWYTIRKKFYDLFLSCPEQSQTGKASKHIDRWIGHNNVYVYAPKLLPSRQMEDDFERGAFSERRTLGRKRGNVTANYRNVRLKHDFYE